MAQRCDTSETAIAITFLVMNLCTLLRRVYGLFLSFLAKNLLWGGYNYENLYFLKKKLSKFSLIRDDHESASHNRG
jgi:hypothetical protein